jgi:hypothetical protein
MHRPYTLTIFDFTARTALGTRVLPVSVRIEPFAELMPTAGG